MHRLTEHFRTHHADELARKDQLTASVGPIAAVLTVLSGAFVYFISNLPLINSLWVTTHLLLLCTGGGFFVLAAYHTVHGLFKGGGYWYSYPPTGKEAMDYYEATVKSRVRRDVARRRLYEQLSRRYGEGQTHNFEMNNRRHEHIYRAHESLALTLGAILLAAVTFAAAKATDMTMRMDGDIAGGIYEQRREAVPRKRPRPAASKKARGSSKSPHS